jgi:hypothetical protein
VINRHREINCRFVQGGEWKGKRRSHLLAEGETKGRASTVYATSYSILVTFVVPLLGNGYGENEVRKHFKCNLIGYGGAIRVLVSRISHRAPDGNTRQALSAFCFLFRETKQNANI